MTRQKSRRPPPANARARRDLVSPEQAEIYKAELLDRLLHNQAILMRRARQAGLVEQADGTALDPAPTTTDVTAPRSCWPPADV